jgi:signal transduction histidine kinase/CheY-like chemotaxis protein/HPt (histidine-containing phosphotransfer) domain-containing protein
MLQEAELMNDKTRTGSRAVIRHRFLILSKIISFIIITIGIIVLCGWILNIEIMKSFYPNAENMTANAAILFIFCGISLYFLNVKAHRIFSKNIAIIFGIIVLVGGLLTTLEYATSLNFGIDQLIFEDPSSSFGTFPPGRMTLLAAINFTLVGIAILLIYIKRWVTLSQVLTVLGLLLGGLSVIGYLYGVDSLYDISSITQMTLPTTITCIALNIGILLSHPDDGLMSVSTSDTLGGMMIKRLLPMAIIVPFLIGFLRLAGENLGLYSMEAGMALMVFFTIITFVVIIWLNGLSLHNLDKSRRKLQRDIIRAKQIAESATRAKSEFLANMSHEIRTPINGITGMISLALDSEMPQAQREYLQHASSSARTLTRVIDDILDFSKIEAGKLELETVDFNIDHIFEEMKALFSNDAAARGLAMTFEVHPDVPKDLVGDPVRLKQVLMNLLRNALKFTPRGSVALRAEPESTAQNSKITIRFSIADTGIGIPEDKISLIFEAFSQVDGSTTRLYGGTGLGLTISKKLVGMMGGRIWVESNLGKGSTFFFTASFDRGTHSVARSVELPAANMAAIPRGLRIYLADDNEVNRILMNNLLAKIGASVMTVDNGFDMLKAFENEAPDLILMDIQMPKLDGVQTTKRIREIEGKSGTHTPIIAVTGHALKGDREKFLAAGMDGYIPEPIDINTFFELIAKITLHLPPRDPDQKSQVSIDEWIDLNDFRMRVRDDNELIGKLLELYLEDSREYLAQIEDAIRNNNSGELERSAHSLKGMSANLSAYRVSELAAQLEDIGESGHIVNVESILTTLRESLNKTIRFIESYLKRE